MEPVCFCGRVKPYELCCKPLHYLPTTYFKPKGATDTVRLPRLSRDVISAPFNLGTLAQTWPGNLWYLFGKQRSSQSTAAFDEQSYRARFLLMRPGRHPYIDEILTANDAVGDSDFKVRDRFGRFGHSDGVRITVNGDTNEMFGVVNARGNLKAIDYGPFQASSWEYAEQFATVHVNRALSLLALRFDSPLLVCSAYFLHLLSGANRTIQIVPNWQVSIPEIITTSTNSLLRQCSSLYREGSNSTSVLYGFLCFFKITELLQAERKRRSRREQSSEEITPERLPDGDAEALNWFSSLSFVIGSRFDASFLRNFLPARVTWGMEFETVLRLVYKPKRDEVAHSFDLDKNLDPDDSELIHGVRLMLPLLKMIVRQMVKNEFPHLLEPASTLN